MSDPFESYGAFKADSSTPFSISLGRRIARKLGLKNQYLRFLKDARRDLPVLELGCGSGGFMAAMMAAGFVDVSGVEPSGTYQPIVDARRIKKRYAHEHLAQMEDCSVGTIIALDVFEHIPLSGLRELLPLMHRRLSPGGILMFRVPNMASPLALTNYFGDLTHVTPLNEVSLTQLIFETESGFEVQGVYAEPIPRPRSIRMVLGVLFWPLYRALTSSALAAFGIPTKVLTPNLVCVLVKT